MKITEVDLGPIQGEPVSGQTYGQYRTTYAHRRRRNWYAEQVAKHYGTKCGCCDTKRMVSVWPKDGRTKAQVVHPEGTANSGRSLRAGAFNQWLTEHDFPAEFEALCNACAARKRTKWGCDDEAHEYDRKQAEKKGYTL